MATEEPISARSQYGDRRSTDRQWTDLSGTRTFTGLMDSKARFVEQRQLFSTEDWELFVRQFKIASDDPDLGWRGEFFGKMMRGACMTWQYTKNEALYCVLEDAVKDMLAAQQPSGRISTYSEACEFHGWDMWSRKYVMLGLLHFHEICRSAALQDQIEQALLRHLDYIIDHVGPGKLAIDETSDYWQGINSASILEPVVRLYNLTGIGRYLDFARYIVGVLADGRTNVFRLALENRLLPYQYPVVKAYELMSCFEGLIEYYRVTGEEQWKTAVVHFTDSVMASDITITGCAGCYDELLNHGTATQTDPSYTGIMQETCVSVTWMKLCAQLLHLTGEAKYADCIERTYLNALCGAINTCGCVTNGGFVFDSYSPVLLGVRGRKVGGYKTISARKHYGCCTSIGSAGTALPLLNACNGTARGICINFYETGEAAIGGFRLNMQTDWPISGGIRITLDETAPGEREIALRLPAFAGAGTRLLVNGVEEPVKCSGTASYVRLCRAWHAGDQILLSIDLAPHLLRPLGVDERPESRNYVAVQYGPLVLARDARLGPVGTPVHADGALRVTPVDKQGFDCVLRARVELGGEALDMIDYGSAGKTWNDDSLMEAWMKTK